MYFLGKKRSRKVTTFFYLITQLSSTADNDNIAYVIKGRIVYDEDGNIDYDRSDDTIYYKVYDKEGNEVDGGTPKPIYLKTRRTEFGKVLSDVPIEEYVDNELYPQEQDNIQQAINNGPTNIEQSTPAESVTPNEYQDITEKNDSTEFDGNGLPFVKTSNGVTDFGYIPEDTGLTPAPIRLSIGDERTGAQHIADRHGEQIAKAGFDNVVDFVEYVASNYDTITEGVDTSGEPNGTYLLQAKDKHNNTLYVELSNDGSYWNVNSGGVFRKGYGEKNKVVWSASEVQRRLKSATPDTLRSQDEADNQGDPNRTVSDTTSTDKGTTNNLNEQEEFYNSLPRNKKGEIDESQMSAEQKIGYAQAEFGQRTDLVRDYVAEQSKALSEKIAKLTNKTGKSVAEYKELAAMQEDKNVFVEYLNEQRQQQEQATPRRTVEEAAAEREERRAAEKEQREQAIREKEERDGVPDFMQDTPEDARLRGFRLRTGERIDRQEPIETGKYNTARRKFTNDTGAVEGGRPEADIAEVGESRDVLYMTTDEINDRLNEELQQQIDGTLPKGHVYSLGIPNDILRSAGLPNLPIEMSAEMLKNKSSAKYRQHHPFDISSIKDLPRAIQNPIAVFNNPNNDGKVLLTELQYNGVNHIVAIKVRSERKSNNIEIDVNSVSTIFPKDRIEKIVEWLLDKENQGRKAYLNKEKVLTWLSDNETITRSKGYNTKDIAKVIKDFENPTLSEEKNEETRLKVSKRKARGATTEKLEELVTLLKKTGFADVKTGEDFYNALAEIEGSERYSSQSEKKLYNPRGFITPVRGEWTKEKIKKRLKESGGSLVGYGRAAKLISEFDSPDELAENIFYHGTVYGSGRLKPSILMSDMDVERYGGGGYGDKYWGISVSRSKKIASNFSGTSKSVSILPIVLAKGAKVKEMPNIEDSSDIDDVIVDLWKEGIDAVWVGDKNKGEQELCVINPRAIVNINRADTYRVYGLGGEENPINIINKEGIKKLYEDAKQYREQKKIAPKGPLKPFRFYFDENNHIGDKKPDDVYDREMKEYEEQLRVYESSDEYKKWQKAQEYAQDNIRFMIGKQARAKYEDIIRKKNPNITQEDLKTSLDFLHSLEDNKENAKAIKVAVKWLADDTIRLPYAIDNVRKAIAVAEKNKVDPTQYSSPMDIIDEFYKDVEYGSHIDPDRVEAFKNKRVVGKGKNKVAIYDIDDNRQGQEAVCKICHEHFGYSVENKDSKQPWCLASFTRKGKPTESAIKYWDKTYNSVGKKIAFKDGKPIAFMAHDRGHDYDLWWNLRDEPSDNLPLPNGRYISPEGEIELRKYGEGEDELFDEAVEYVADELSDSDVERILGDLKEKIDDGVEDVGISYLFDDAEERAYEKARRSFIETTRYDIDSGDYDKYLKEYIDRYKEKYHIGEDEEIDEDDLDDLKDELAEDIADNFEDYDGAESIWNDIFQEKYEDELYNEDYSLSQKIDMIEDHIRQYPMGSVADDVSDKEIELRGDDLEVDELGGSYRYSRPNGTVLGFVKGNTIYLNPDEVSLNTPIHEFGHLWVSQVKEHFPDLWAKGKELFLESDYLRKVQADPNYRHLDLDGQIDEAMARAIGDRGEQELDKTLLEKILDWIAEVWDKIGGVFGIDNLTSEQISNLTLQDFTDMATSELLSGQNLTERVNGNRGGATRYNTADETADIKARAIADGTFMKAPNGKDTNLTERQWLQVRTKAFKKWFGDWEKTARIEKLKKTKPIEITGEEYKGKYELNRDSAKAYIKDSLRGEYTNKDTGDTILLAKDGAQKVTSHSMGNEAHLKSIAVIPELIEKSIFIDELPNEKNNGKYDSYRYYVSGLKIGGVDYTVKLAIGIDEYGNKYYDHSLTEIEKGKLIDEVGALSTTLPSSNQSALSEYKDSKLISLLQENSSKVVDENGEPMVVYHGTNNEFYTFEEREGYNSELLGGERKVKRAGFFFSPNKNFANNYGRHNLPVFLNIKNLFNFKEHYYYTNSINETLSELFDEFVEYADEQGINLYNDYPMGYDYYIISPDDIWRFFDDELGSVFKRFVQSKGFDGVWFPEWNSDVLVNNFMLFSPTQIKSATDNIGTFNEEDEDIRYSVEGADYFVNERFNEQLEKLTENNADSTIFYLGEPSGEMLAVGIKDSPLKLYGNKLQSKAKKHGFDVKDVKDLPEAIHDPIAIFEGAEDGSFAILTELSVGDNNVLATLSVGKGNDVDFNIVSSVYGKYNKNIVGWINKGKTLYVNKEKALDYLRISAPIAEAQDKGELNLSASAGKTLAWQAALAPIASATLKQELITATKVIENFENPPINEKKVIDGTASDMVRYSIKASEQLDKEDEVMGETKSPQTKGFWFCDPEGIRTPDPQLRRLLLYPAELPDLYTILS